MANDIAKKYTDEIYLSKSRLQEVLNTSLVDGYWKEIRAYRGAFAHRLNVKTLRKDFQMGIILTPSIKAKIDLLDNDIKAFASALKKMDVQDKEEAGKNLYYENLSSLTKIENVPFSEAALKQVVAERYRPLNDNDFSIISFYQALRSFAQGDKLLPPNEDFLGEAYSRLLGRELTSFYRTKDFDNRARLAEQRDQDYPYAPIEKVEGAMSDLFKALDTEEFPVTIRALLALYYVDAVSPFDSKNKELSILFGMDVFAEEYGRDAFYLPLASVLEDSDKKKEAISGVRTGDFTYYVLYAVEVLREKITSLTKELQDIILTVVAKEAHPLSSSETNLLNGELEQMSLLDTSEEKPVSRKEPVYVESKKTEAPKPVVKPLPKKELIRPERVSKPVEKIEEEISISMDHRSLSEKEAKEYTQYLLESNPNLNKKQASFLATHCSLGHYYTIQQYKKFARCAYETARTSMDKLATEAYYEKKQVKNKYVYTPIAVNDKR